MALYCIGDIHLSLAASKPMDIFGSRWQGYTEKLTRGWNSVVSPDDTVVVAGDISWGMTLEEAAPDLEFLSALNGQKLILKGNHDFWWQSQKKIDTLFAEKGIDNIKPLHNNAYAVGDLILCGSRGWFCDPKASPENTDPEKISAREVLRTEFSLRAGLELNKDGSRELIAFFHFPPVYRGWVCRGIVDLLHRYGVKRCCYGHIHGVYDIPPTFLFEDIAMTIVSADYLRFIPLLIV